MDKIETLIMPHREREANLVAAMRDLERQLAEVKSKLTATRERIAGIEEVAEAFGTELAAVKQKPKRGSNPSRALTGHWQKIMQGVAHLPSFGYAELARSADAIGHTATNDTLRSQMSEYKKRGYVETSGIGAFRLTEIGLKAIGYDRNVSNMLGLGPFNENEPPGGQRAGGSETRGWGASPPSPRSDQPSAWDRT